MEKWRHSKYVARPVSVRITHRFASPPRAGNQNTSLKHWPERNALRRQHWSWLGPDEPIRLLALDRPAGTLPRVREDKVGDPCPTAPACLHFPWQCMTVCVSGRVFLCPCILGTVNFETFCSNREQQDPANYWKQLCDLQSQTGSSCFCQCIV